MHHTRKMRALVLEVRLHRCPQDQAMLPAHAVEQGEEAEKEVWYVGAEVREIAPQATLQVVLSQLSVVCVVTVGGKT